jgi:hypothetical protein
MAISDYPFHILKTPGTITATPVGLAFGVTLDGGALTSTDDSSGSWLKHATLAATNNSGGMQTGIDVLAGGWRPTTEFEIRTPPSAELANTRLWVGLFSTKPDGLSVPGSNQHFAAFRFDKSLPDTNWMAVSHNGSGSAQVADTLVSVAQSTIYKMAVAISGSNAIFTINGGTATVLSPAPGSSTLLALGVRVTTLAAAAKSIEWRRVSWSFL